MRRRAPTSLTSLGESHLCRICTFAPIIQLSLYLQKEAGDRRPCTLQSVRVHQRVDLRWLTSLHDLLTAVPVCCSGGRKLLFEGCKKTEDAEVEYVSKRFTFAKMQDDPSLVSFYTGLPGSAFQFLLKCLEKAELTYACGWKDEKLKLEDQILLIL